ncbi:unnamed protein product [Lathyrus sativus]|nr:unnamed protein product [Lathyrus sativus]
MECLNRYLFKMQQNSNFNCHPKCEKLNITNLCFADDLLLFSRGDKNSVDLMMAAYAKFSKATGLVVNPQKCRIYLAGVDEKTKKDIRMASDFQMGQLPFRYLGVPVTSKKLSIAQYSSLIDKIVEKVQHWTTRLLTYAGRLQLIKSVMFATTNYWLNCFPFPKGVLKKIETICHIFLWTGGFAGNRKSPVSWKQVCKPFGYGGLDIIDIEVLNNVNLMKLLWNLSGKEDSLWGRWIQAYYIKNRSLLDIECTSNDSWIMKVILSQRDDLTTKGKLAGGCLVMID